MTTYLFTWNPERWNWKYLQGNISEVKENGYSTEPWSCGVTKKIHKGDRAFLIKLGKTQRHKSNDSKKGIVASGWVVSGCYEADHWDKDANARGKSALFVEIDWDLILDPQKEIFPIEQLSVGVYRDVHWTPQASGMHIPENVAEQLEKDWAKFLNRPRIVAQTKFAEEVENARTFIEGSKKQITVNAYERSPEARSILY